jgi:hypothetical protein
MSSLPISQTRAQRNCSVQASSSLVIGVSTRRQPAGCSGARRRPRSTHAAAPEPHAFKLHFAATRTLPLRMYFCPGAPAIPVLQSVLAWLHPGLLLLQIMLPPIVFFPGPSHHSHSAACRCAVCGVPPPLTLTERQKVRGRAVQ